MSGMATANIPYVQSFTNRHGRVQRYFRRAGWPRKKLPGEPGSPEFMIAYAEAMQAAPLPKAKAQPQPRSINALVAEYYRSAEWKGLRASTQRGYRNHLERFRAKHGHRGVSSVQPHHLEAIFHQMSDTPGAARNLRKRLRRLFRLAVRLGWRTDNPVAETEAPRTKTGGFAPWSEDDIAAFEARWETGTKPRLALALLLYTGQRRSDVVVMGRQHVKAGRISVAQVKTDARLSIRIHDALKVELDQCPTDALTFLRTEYGRPFSAAGFTKWLVARAVDAGLIDRSPHGLRKAAGRRLAEAGCSAKQIAAVLGHASLNEVARYTRDADQERLADAAIDALRIKG
jgi:integrase